MGPLINANGGRRVRAEVIARYVFNFQITAERARDTLPPWLTPELIDGTAILSFCPYLLRRLHIAGQPSLFGLSTICSAPRITANDGERRVAWVPARQATARVVGLGAQWHLSTQRFEHIRATFPTAVDDGQFEVVWPASQQVFRATLTPQPASQPMHTSTVFATTHAFERYFTCESAWSPSMTRDHFMKLDLVAAGTQYRPMDVTSINWSAAGPDAIFDSAFVGIGGKYCWTATDLARRALHTV